MTSVTPEWCREWEECAAEAAAGRWASVAWCTVWRRLCHPTFSLLLCQELNNSIDKHRCTSILIGKEAGIQSRHVGWQSERQTLTTARWAGRPSTYSLSHMYAENYLKHVDEHNSVDTPSNFSNPNQTHRGPQAESVTSQDPNMCCVLCPDKIEPFSATRMGPQQFYSTVWCPKREINKNSKPASKFWWFCVISPFVVI